MKQPWLKIISGLDDEGYRNYTIHCLLQNTNRDEILQLLKTMDLGFSDLKVEQSQIAAESLPREFPDFLKSLVVKNGGIPLTSVQTMHPKLDAAGTPIATELLSLSEHESEGTQKIFALAGPLVDTLKNGRLLVIDEFDARLHPLLSHAIVQLFNSNETNPNHAQLVFMTHDTNLLSNKIFRRDQIWFAEKNKYAATDLYSLAEYGVRKDASFESDYIKGKYGAIPYIGSLSHLLESHV
jgi:uncharacterized protein